MASTSSSVNQYHSISSREENQPETSHHHSSSDEDENQIDFSNLNLTLDPSIYDPRDEATQDRWIRRNQSMIRLTGKHPFNAEPPADKLMGFGFITPAPIHFVRSHGYVPEARWEDWTVEVTGLVKNPTSFTMDQLMSQFPSFQLPVTLVCAGNRRKEQNMVKQTVGFNWGSGAVSTSVWRGVRLRDVLKRCGIFTRTRGALNVCFEGAEDSPGGGGSKYGTSLRKELAMDPARDVMIAYMQNGERLLPDHGYPVRMIIPGFIGGRMVKWLKRIIVTTKESESYYHYHDNRVLPSHVDAELADSQGWWYKPEYIITELNINSVITTPSDGDTLFIDAAMNTTQTPYKLEGYAYSGGGKKVTRVEVTLDGGESWLHCALDHRETPSRYGKYWCWCFWSLQLQLDDLGGAEEISVRAWDESLNTQPEKLIWNLMGMMNNCWFGLKITNICVSQQGDLRMVFKHPTQPGNNPGGWMVPNTKNSTIIEKNDFSLPLSNTSSIVYSMDEIKKHNSAESAWIVVHDNVYDCTPFLNNHPGGATSILTNSGIDCTKEFDDIHSEEAKILLGSYKIGEVAG